MPDIPPQAQVWSLAGQSATGSSHVRFGIPNQDAIAWRPKEPAAAAVLALADGHGARIHFRSSAGAHIAIETAIAVLSDAIAEPGWIKAADTEAAQHLVDDIVQRWQRAVMDDLAQRPLAPGEAGERENPFIPYGTTLIAAAVTPVGVVVLQLGDGDLLLATADGVVFRPLASDQGLEGEQTYSLCLPDARERTRVAVFPARLEDIDFIMLSTDGLAKSFVGNTAFLRHAASWRLLIKGGGLAAVTDKLERWLASASMHGSGDDVTLGFMVRGDGADPRAIENVSIVVQDTVRATPARPREAVGYGLTGAGMLAIVLLGFIAGRWLW